MKKLIAVSILAASLVSGVAFAREQPPGPIYIATTTGAEMEGGSPIIVVNMFASAGSTAFAEAAAAHGLTLTSITTTLAKDKAKKKIFTFAHKVPTHIFAEALGSALGADWNISEQGNHVIAAKGDTTYSFTVNGGTAVTLDLDLAADSGRALRT